MSERAPQPLPYPCLLLAGVLRSVPTLPATSADAVRAARSGGIATGIREAFEEEGDHASNGAMHPAAEAGTDGRVSRGQGSNGSKVRPIPL